MAAKWTFMVYMAGYNNLSPFATQDLQEMRQVGSTDEVKVAVFIKRWGQRSAHHILVGKDGQQEQHKQLGGVDSGDPQTMLDFVRWAAQVAPAERYALVVWNHGSGWGVDDLDQIYAQVRGGEGPPPERELAKLRATGTLARTLFAPSVKEILAKPDARERAIASDDGTGHSLDTIELNRVLKKSNEEVLGQPLEVLGMDACLMSTLEVAYQIERHAKVVVGSEDLEPGDGWPYHRVLRALADAPDMDGRDLGGVIVDRYIGSYRNAPGQWPVTQSAVMAAELGPFADTLDDLAMALRREMRDEQDAMRVARAHSRATWFEGELVDLRTFCRELRATAIGAPVKEAAGAVIEALKPGDFVAAEGHLGDEVAGCAGVTVYFPTPYDEISPFYKDLRFAQRHGWDEFLRSYRRAVRGD